MFGAYLYTRVLPHPPGLYTIEWLLSSSSRESESTFAVEFDLREEAHSILTFVNFHWRRGCGRGPDTRT